MNREEIHNLLSQPPAAADLEVMTDAINALEAEVNDGEAEIQARRAEVDQLKADRDALRGYRNFVAHFAGGKTPAPQPTRKRPSARRGSKGEAIEQLLADGRELEVAQIRQELIANDVIGDSDPEYHALQVTLSRMYRKGQLERPRFKVYKLPFAAPAANGHIPQPGGEVEA